MINPRLDAALADLFARYQAEVRRLVALATEPEPEPTRPDNWPASTEWVFQEMHPEDGGSLAERYGLGRDSLVVVADSSEDRAVQKALLTIQDQILEMDDPSDTDIVVVIEDDVDEIHIGTGSPWSGNYVRPEIFRARSINIIAPKPEFEAIGRGLLPVGQVKPKANIRPFKAINGGDTIALGAGSRSAHDSVEDSHIRFLGCGLMTGGRSIMNTRTEKGVKLELAYCHLSRDPEVMPSGALKWGLQLNLTSVTSLRCSAHMDGLREHVMYSHGHCAGAADHHEGWYITATGGQCFQYTQRPAEVRYAASTPVTFKNCVMKGMGQHTSRASYAITFAGAGREVVIDNCVIVDDNPFDTPGQSPNKQDTSYGGIVVWSKQDAENGSYRHLTDGYAHESITVRDTVVAIREPNRTTAKFSDARKLRIERVSLLNAGRLRRSGRINDASYGEDSYTAIPDVKVDPRIREIPQVVRATFAAMLEPDSEVMDYSEIPWECNGVTQSPGSAFQVQQ